MSDINCPRAKTWMTPCIARDGHTALADDGDCVGCGHKPHALLAELAERWPEAGRDVPADPERAANRLVPLIVEYLDSGHA